MLKVHSYELLRFVEVTAGNSHEPPNVSTLKRYEVLRGYCEDPYDSNEDYKRNCK